MVSGQSFYPSIRVNPESLDGGVISIELIIHVVSISYMNFIASVAPGSPPAIFIPELDDFNVLLTVL
jgi:hypothetical protein